MGSSVFHGGFSTFIAIIVLAPSQTYIFLVFFRLWFGIILFGLANGFILVPVILSIIGPTYTIDDHSDSGKTNSTVTPDTKSSETAIELADNKDSSKPNTRK